MFNLNDIPPGFVKINPGEDMPKESYYLWQHNKAEDINNINSWAKYGPWAVNEKRHDNDDMVWFIKPVPAPKVKPIFKGITDINIGDVFAYQDTGEPVIVNVEKYTLDEDSRKYVILGLMNTLTPFSFTPLNKKDTISYLNLNKYIYITSIAPQIEKTLKLARKIVLEGK